MMNDPCALIYYWMSHLIIAIVLLSKSMRSTDFRSLYQNFSTFQKLFFRNF